MKKVSLIVLSLFVLYSCQSLNSTQKGNFQKRIQRITPNDIKGHTQKILVGKYQFTLEESQESRSSLYIETSWKNVELLDDENKKNLEGIRVRFKVRSRETRSGPENTYNMHNLKFNAEVESYKNRDGNTDWARATITPLRMNYLQDIYRDYKLEFDSGVINYN